MMSDLKTPEPKHHGVDILRDPRLNKMTCFSEEEREALGLVGLVPEGIDTETTQVERVLYQLSRKPTDLSKYIYLTALLDNDETLFFRVLMSDPARFMPLVYTPSGRSLPAVRSYPAAAARPLSFHYAARPIPGDPAQLAGTGRSYYRRYRRRAHPGPGRPWRQRNGYPDWQASTLHRLRWRAAASYDANPARRRHQQWVAAEGPALPGRAPAARAWGR